MNWHANSNEGSSLLEPSFLNKLEKLHILSRKIKRGSIKGERMSPKKGKSVEFSDHREYTLGDELRTIDWNIYGRLNRLFVKLFREEEELILYLLIDSSNSMAFGNPPKLDFAKKIALSLSYIALSDYDRVSISIGGSGLLDYKYPLRGRKQIFKLIEYISQITPKGGTSISKFLYDFAVFQKRAGFVVVISDFLDPSDFFKEISRLIYQKNELFLIQVLDKEELNPSILGDVELIDVEGLWRKELSIDGKLLSNYKKRIASFCDNIKSFCYSQGASYILCPTYVPFEDIVLEFFLKGRLLR